MVGEIGLLRAPFLLGAFSPSRPFGASAAVRRCSKSLPAIWSNTFSSNRACYRATTNLVGAIGFEPTTPTMSRWCSNQLSYAPARPKTIPVWLPCCNSPRCLPDFLDCSNQCFSSPPPPARKCLYYYQLLSYPQISRLHVVDLVAQPGGLLEFQVAGVFIHALLELFDLPIQLLR